MRPKVHTVCISVFLALLICASIRCALAGDVLYEDDFTNLDPSWGTPGDILSVKNGNLVLKPAVNTTQSVINEANVFEDADIQLNVRLSSGDPSIPGGLIFWARDYTNFYCFSIAANGSFKISRFVMDRWLTPVGWTPSSAINPGIGQINKLRVVTRGREAIGYINDKEVVTINGQPPQGGGCVGISGGSAQDTQNTWEFASLRVINTAAQGASEIVSQAAPTTAQSAPAPAQVQQPARPISQSSVPAVTPTPPPAIAPSHTPVVEPAAPAKVPRQEATPPFDDQGGEIIWHQVDGKWKWRPRDPAHFKGITPRPPEN
jgi:hypothetical protein